jgi:anaerobic selenocysteine-containing dehydrogenase
VKIMAEVDVGMKEIITSCTCDCPDTCSIVARVEGDRLVEIRGNPGFEVTRGFLCRKARGFLTRLFNPDRILHPLLREGSNWRRLSWEKAADIIAGKVEQALAAYGPAALYYFRDAGSIAALKLVNERFFNLLGGGTFASGSLCGGAGVAGQTADFGYRTSHDPFDVLNSSLVIIWGRNPAWTNVHLLPLLKEAKRRGAEVVLIDPVRTASAKVADRHLSPVPGSDIDLALGMARVLAEEGLLDRPFLEAHARGYEDFLALARSRSLEQISEVTGVTAKDIRELAILYGQAKPAAILGGWGFQRSRKGAAAYRALDALGALTGNIGRSGGGVSHGMDETRWFERAVCLRDRATARREIPKPVTGKGLLEATKPPVRVAFVSSANPISQCPNAGVVRQAFAGIDFVAVIDMFMTDTASAADIVLPTTHFLQEDDILGSYWHNYVMPVNVAQPRLGEEKTDLEIFAVLGRRLGVGGEFPDDPDWYLEQLIAPLKRQGLTLDDLMRGPVRPEAAMGVPFADLDFPTQSSKFEFTDELPVSGGGGSEAFPYHLLSPHPQERTHSQILGVRCMQRPEALISPALARLQGLEDGDALAVMTTQGSLECITKVTEVVRPDTVVVYEGWWESLGGCVNKLTADDLSDIGMSATFNDVRCNVSRVAEE